MFQALKLVFQDLEHKFQDAKQEIVLGGKTFLPKGKGKYSEGKTNVLYVVIPLFPALVINKMGMLSTFSAECRPKRVLFSHF